MRSQTNATKTYKKQLLLWLLAGVLLPTLLLPTLVNAKDTNTSTTQNKVQSNNLQMQQANHDSSLYALLQAEFEIDRGQIKKGINTYKQQAMLNETASVFERALTLSLTHEKTEDSLKFVSKWRQKYPQHIPAWFYEANLALKAHEYKHASDALSRILRHDPQADLSQILVGILPNNEADQRELLDTLQKIDNKQNTSLSAMQAGLLLKFNELEAALKQTNIALKKSPQYVPFITLKADILKNLGNPNEVLDFLNQSRKTVPDSQKLYLYQIRYLLALNKNQQAADLLTEATKKFSNNKQITLLAALVNLDLKEYPKAEKLLTKLLTDEEYADEANYYLGISATRQKNPHKAVTYFKKVTQDNLILDAQQQIVDFYLTKKAYDKALKVIQNFRAQYDIYAPESYIMQAQVLTQQQLTNDAKNLLKDATEEYPNNPELWFAYSQVLNNETDFVLKTNLLKRLNSLEPDNNKYQLALAELYLSNNPTDKQGLSIAQKIADINYNSSNFNSSQHIQALTLLAAAALKQDKPQKVIDYLQNEYDIMPTLPAGLLLWQAYQKLNQTNKAQNIQTNLQESFGYQISAITQ